MPEILPEYVPSPRTPLVWEGTRYRAVRGHTDGTVQVRGEDQLFSFGAVIGTRTQGVISGADGYLETPAVGAGERWIITNIALRDLTSPLTAMSTVVMRNGNIVSAHEEIRAFAAGDLCYWTGHAYLDADDRIRGYFAGGLVGDTCQVNIIGYQMTLET